MKKLLTILLALLFLSGCGAKPQTQQSQAQEDAPQLPSLYEANTVVEAGTDGAVRAYRAGERKYVALLPFGEQVLVVDESGNLMLLKGKEGYITAEAQTELNASWSLDDLCIHGKTLAYYVSDRLEVVLLDDSLQVTSRISLPENIQGRPMLQLARGEILYCTDGQIRALDILSGVSRLVRTHTTVSQELLGSYFDDTVISCLVVDAQGEQRVLYLDAETGEELYEGDTALTFLTYGERYYTRFQENGLITEYFGSRSGPAWYLDEAQQLPLLERNAAVGYESLEGGLRLSYYDLESGKKTSQVILPAVQAVTAAAGDGSGVWLLADGTLCYWDLAETAVKEETVYTTRVYTKEDPDLVGLDQCTQRATELGEEYGFTLTLWEDAAQAGKNQGAVAEHEVVPLNQAMDRVEAVLKKLPKDFLSITGDVQIHLVRSMQDGAADGLYWKDGACHILLAGTEITDSLLRLLGCAVDTRVLGNSFDYDKWDELNPWWFDYTYDYEKNLQRKTYENCLEGDNRYFTDEIAMSFPTEDRSRLFACAAAEGNEEMFQPSPIQKKLRAVCVAIREAYGWEDNTEVFVWEQYLKKPIAPSE